MRGMILWLLTAGATILFCSLSANAVGTRYPFCIQGPDQPGLSNCTFTSYEQCQASASGRVLSCVANPFYVGEREEQVIYPDRGPPRPLYPDPSRH